MMEITKEFDFDAAHWLPEVPADHKCRRLHGHTYRVVVMCSGIVGPMSGMVVDYADIAKAWAPLHDLLDHRCLNGVPPGMGCPEQFPVLKNPTTENLAALIVDKLRIALPSFSGVRVYEFATTYAELRLPAPQAARKE